MVVLDSGLKIVSASRSFYNTFGVMPGQTVGQLLFDLGNGQWDIPELRRLLEEILPRQAALDDYEVKCDFPSLGPRRMLLNARQVQVRPGHAELILLAIEDATEAERGKRVGK